MRIDLHAHSTASDGTDTPTELVAAARAAGLDVLAVTDHDTTGGWAEAAAALPAGLSLVRGAEISCVRDGISLHLLAYLFDPAEPRFAAERAALRDSRLGRAERMVQLLQADGYAVTWEQVRGRTSGSVGRPHIAESLLEAGYLSSLQQAFAPEWLGTGGRYWVGKKELDIADGIALVRGAGGVPVFAHPAASGRGRTVGEPVIRELAAAGLAGLEVDHVDHDDAQRDALRRLAGELGLLVTGSSDYHGTRKAVRLGAHHTEAAVLEHIVGQATGVAVLTG